MENNMQTPHKLLMDKRKNASITGVEEVIAFDTKGVLLKTTMGVMSIKGTSLKVTRLSVEKGELDISGQIDGVIYQDKDNATEKKSLIKRMFE